MPNDPEGDLLERFVHGDQAAFERLFRLFEVEVFRWIMRIVRDRSTAEDAVVEAFWRAYRARATFDWRRSFGAWMRRIATNVALDSLRAAGPSAGRMVEVDTLPAPPAVDPAVRESIEQALARLPPKLRVVAILALIEDRPYDEIADALDIPIGTVKSRVFRATRELRRELARLGITP